MAKGTEYSQQLKEDAVQYRLDHPELALCKAAENLGVSESALKNWMKTAKEHKGMVPTRGSGNCTSDEAKGIARLQRELRDTKDALEVLKKQSVFCQRNTEKIRRFTFRLPCMEETDSFEHVCSPCSFKRKNRKDLRGFP